MELKELISLAKIDFTNCVAELDSGSRLDWKFEISPFEFLSFAKSDFRDGGKKGNINALTNSKRAIDCQIDRIFKSFGYEFDRFPEYLNTFSNYFCEDVRSNDLPIKLRIINAFGMAPAGLVSDARTLRNKMEHYYNSPDEEDVQKSLEIAELFITATEKRLIDHWDFEITDTGHRERAEKTKPSGYGTLSGLYIHRNESNASFNVGYTCPDTRKTYNSEIFSKNESYAPLMRMCINYDQDEEFRRSLIYLLRINEHKIPENQVCVHVDI